MAKNLKLLLTESVDSLGIVGDVVNVRTGYARNFLLPRNMATTPTEEAIQAVAAKRAQAEQQLAELRKQREELVKKLEGIQITIQRSCNDLGHLYASITQQEIASALATAGYPGVRPRDVRLNQNIKRVDTYDVHIKFDAELDATIKLWVVADRKLDLDAAREEAEAAAKAEQKPEEGQALPAAPEAAAEEKPGKERKEKPAREGRDAKPGKDARGAPAEAAAPEKPRKKAKKEGGEPAAAPTEEKKVSTWGKPVDKPDFGNLGLRRPRRERD